PPGIVDLVRRPHDQCGDLRRIAARDERLTADEPGRFALCLAIAAQERAGLVDLVWLGPVVREHTDHMDLLGAAGRAALGTTPFSRRRLTSSAEQPARVRSRSSVCHAPVRSVRRLARAACAFTRGPPRRPGLPPARRSGRLDSGAGAWRPWPQARPAALPPA